MARPLRLEHEGAAWPITARGNERRTIFRSDADRKVFLALLATAVAAATWFAIGRETRRPSRRRVVNIAVS